MPKLPTKQNPLFKLAVWSCLVVWMVFFFAFSLTMAQRAAGWGPSWFGLNTWGQVMTWTLPIWIVFTCLLIVIAVARYAGKKLKSERD